ncbi:MAG: metallophosphoesterase family protein [Patescibacteria group bacterium]
MSTLVFSDTHFTKKFHQRQFDALKKLISESDKIIINGDFWEGFSISFDEFLKSEWNKLFPLLKQKDTVYIYGNHDDKVFSDNRIYQFCNKAADEYCMDTPKQKYLFRHGQDILFPKYSHDRHQKNIKRAGSFWIKMYIKITRFIQNTIFNLLGAYALPFFFNYISKDLRNKTSSLQYLLVCGHTHRPYLNKKNNFIDTGFFDYGWANYLIIDDLGNFTIVNERY